MAINKQNLINPDDLTPEERRESAIRAGKASAAARAERKRLRDALQKVLDCKPKAETIERLGKRIALDNPDITVAQAIALAQVARAMDGDTKAAIWVRDTVGERPADQLNATLDGGMDVAVRVRIVGLDDANG